MELSADDQRKVDRLLAEARGLYDVAVRAALPESLAIAIGAKKPFDELGEPEIEGLCRFVVQLRTLDRAAVAAGAVPAPASKPAKPGKAGAVVPDAVLPPPRRPGASKSDDVAKSGGDTTT